MSEIQVARCGSHDIAAVRRFLDRHWAAGHVLARSPALLDFQHRRDDGTYGLMIARRADEADLLGVLGAITTSHYDPALAFEDTLWLTTWKVRPDVGVTGLGLRLHRRLLDTTPHRAVGTVGNNAGAEAIYRALGYRTGVLEQYVLLDPGRAQLRLARVAPADRRRFLPTTTDHDTTDHDSTDHSAIDLRPVDGETLRAMSREELPAGARATRLPAKTPRYFAARYLDHPIYRYQVLAVVRDGRPSGLVAVRVAEHAGARAVRIVDYLGPDDGLAGASAAFIALLRRHDAEHADVLVAGLPDETFGYAGFGKLDPAGATVVPNYFEPFEAKNVVVRWAFHSDSSDSPTPVLFKGDADQDRPNHLPGDPE